MGVYGVLECYVEQVSFRTSQPFFFLSLFSLPLSLSPTYPLTIFYFLESYNFKKTQNEQKESVEKEGERERERNCQREFISFLNVFIVRLRIGLCLFFIQTCSCFPSSFLSPSLDGF